MLQPIREMIESGDLEAAHAALKQYLAQQPEDAQAWYLLSTITNNPETRHRALERALLLNPNHAGAQTDFYGLNDIHEEETPRRQVPAALLLIAALFVAGIVGAVLVMVSSGGSDSGNGDTVAPGNMTPVPRVANSDAPDELIEGMIVNELGAFPADQIAAGPPAPAGSAPDSDAVSVDGADNAEAFIATPLPVATSEPAPATLIPPQITPVTPPRIVQPPPTGASTDQIVVRFDPDASSEVRVAYLESIGATVTGEIAGLDAVTVSLGANSANQLLLGDVPDDAPILVQEPDYVITAQIDSAAVSDPRYAEQWALPVIGVPESWSALPADAPVVRVAVIDSGICASADLRGRYAGGWDFVDDDADPTDAFGHGCAVAGILAANMNDSTGIAGVAPNVQIMPFRVLDANGIGLYSDAAAAIVQATDNGADIINMSMGGAIGSTVLKDAITYATERGVLVVAAAGNSGVQGVMYPAAYADVVGVGSINRDRSRSLFSTTGLEVDLFAPGVDILAPNLAGGYQLYSGTSFAVPHVTGVAALEMALGDSLRQTGGIVRAFGGSDINPDEIDYPVPGEDFEVITDETIPEGYMIYGGDIIVPVNYHEMTALSVYIPRSLWPEGIVPYTFNGNVSSSRRALAREAMDWWEAVSGVEFVQRTNQYNYVQINDHSQYNNSYVGMIGWGKQDVNIHNWVRGIIAHELGHALGLWHEHMRNDRDNYVIIHWSNICCGAETNFDKVGSYWGRDYSAYDFESIMHYYDTAFAINPYAYTIEAQSAYAAYQNVMGNRSYLSAGDAAGMLYLYPTPNPTATPTPTPTPTSTPTPTGTPDGFEAMMVRDAELLFALQQVSGSSVEYFAVDYTNGEIVVYMRQNGYEGRATVRFDWYPNLTGLNLVQVTGATGGATTSEFDAAVRNNFPHDLAAALDILVEQQFGLNTDVDEILAGEDMLQIGAIPE